MFLLWIIFQLQYLKFLLGVMFIFKIILLTQQLNNSFFYLLGLYSSETHWPQWQWNNSCLRQLTKGKQDKMVPQNYFCRSTVICLHNRSNSHLYMYMYILIMSTNCIKIRKCIAYINVHKCRGVILNFGAR